MPAPNPKSGRKQLNVWIREETDEFIRDYARKKGHNIGEALDRLVRLIKVQFDRNSGGKTDDEEQPL